MGGVNNTEEKNGTVALPAAEPYISDRRFTVPNIICGVRLAGSFVLVAIAWRGQQQVFLWLFVFLAMTDWVDGKLAVLLHQRSVLGARLDSWADTALYVGLLIGALMLKGEVLRYELGWIIPALASYVLSVAAGLCKYQRWPSYHTRAAKTGWFLFIVATIALFSGWSLWPLRIAFAAAVLINLEACVITLISPTWRVDVTSVYHAWRDR